MGIFSKPKPIHPMFDLPRASVRECGAMHLPSKVRMALPSVHWLEMMAQSGDTFASWINRVSETESFWTSHQINCDEVAQAIAYRVMHLEQQHNHEDLLITGIVFSKFGLLLGLYERASNATKPTECHPLIQNVVIGLKIAFDDGEVMNNLPEDASHLLYLCGWAGYVMGKVPDLSMNDLFQEWNI